MAKKERKSGNEYEDNDEEIKDNRANKEDLDENGKNDCKE